MSNTYFFIPGRNRELSLAEFKSVIEVYKRNNNNIFLDVSNFEYFLFSTDIEEKEVEKLFNTLGGFIKYGEVLNPDIEISSLSNEKKITFGVSGYCFSESYHDLLIKYVKNILKTIKQDLKSVGKQSRFVGGGTRVLTSGQVEGNRLLQRGFEIVLLMDKDKKVTVGRTKAVQDMEGYSKRDFQKPFVDTRMGVLPPKLARIMLNLASLKKGSTIWDPFCGSGNVLLEAMMLGYNAIGSDIDGGAINACRKNIEWLEENFELDDVGYNIFNYDVTRFDKRLINKLQNTDLHALVFEPFMGPPQRQPISVKQADALLSNTIDLYLGIFDTIEHLKKRNMRIVSVFPSYKTHEGWMTKRLNEHISKKWKISPISKDLHWERSNSIIMRNLLVIDYQN